MDMAGSIRENIKIRRGYFLRTPGQLYTYIHNSPPFGQSRLGKIAGVISITNEDNGILTENQKKSILEQNLGNVIKI